MKRACFLLLLAIALAGCASPPTSPHAARFAGLVRELADPAMEGRGIGTAGLDRARDRIVDLFRDAGLTPGFADDSFTQAVDAPLAAEASRAELKWRADDQARSLRAGAAYDFSVLGISGDGAFAGEPVFVGYAVESGERGYDSLAGRADVLRGRIAVAFRYEPMDDDGRSRWSDDGRWTDHAALATKAAWASQHGATALLVVDPPSKEAGGVLLSTARSSVAEPAAIPVLHLRGAALRRMLRDAGLDARAAVRAWQDTADRGTFHPQVLRGVTVEGAAAVTRRTATIHNVAAIAPGTGSLRDETLVVGAHYDHLGYGEAGSRADGRAIHPGADDNASGVAAVLMLAERWAARPATEDRRTVVFVAFSGEEHGLLGSAHLVAHPDALGFDLSRTVAMINFDMIGRLRDGRLTVMGAGTGDRWDEAIARAGAGLPLDLNVSREPSALTDHVPFHARKIPTLHLFTGLHEDYHRPGDTADKVNAAGGAAIVDLTDALLRELTRGPAMQFTGEP